MKPPSLHALTFDIEEHFHAGRFDSPMRRRQWDFCQSRVERNVIQILDLLERQDTRATFFVLGWIAERQPDLIRRLVCSGHEVACLGYAHELVTAQTPQLFRNDVRKAKYILEDLIGQPVRGYRAPSFTITADTEWALHILVEEGFIYDSSIFPIIHDLCGIPSAVPTCHQRWTSSGPLWELPPSTISLGGLRVPIGGGGYLRLLPYSWSRQLLKRAESAGDPLILYLKTWEIDPEQPRMNGPWSCRFRHYVNLHKTKGRLDSLLRDFRFAPIREAIRPMAPQLSPRSVSIHDPAHRTIATMPATRTKRRTEHNELLPL
ncbi:MAG: XrtA system polysaccharide deacetylase [Nitrospiraceae bacterium]